MKDFNDRMGKEVVDKFWAASDDAIGTLRDFGLLYDNVPKHLKNVQITVMEFHIFPEDKKEELLAWLNRED